MRYLLLNIAIFLMLVQSAFSRDLDAPVVTCLEVHYAGDVTIYWQSLDTTALEFQIFFSTDNITWEQAGSVDSQNQSLQFYHSLAQANNQLYYYYIKAIYQTEEVDSDVFKTIFLVVDNSTAGLATLLWNPVRIPLPEGSSSYYKIYSSVYEEGLPPIWNLITDDFENTLYNYVIPNGLCDDIINFKIEIENTYACSSISNIAGDFFSEYIQPEKPIFDSVSISANSIVILGWESSVSPDVAGTIIFRYESGIWIGVDTVFGNGNTYYTDSSHQPCVQNYQYAIAAIDSCGIVSPGSFSTPLRPIFLYDIDYHICSETNSLAWEPYINASPPLEKYEIWTSVAGGAAFLVDEVPANTDYYNHTGVENITEYNYFIRAVFGDFTSTSCTKSISTGSFTKPDSVYLANANVLPDNNIELTLNIDLKPQSCTWEILRSDAGGGQHSLLTTLSRNDITSSPYIFLDETADGSTGFYIYSINVFDSCEALVLQSNDMKTIFLEGQQLTDDENYLSWNAMEGYEGGVGSYLIYRMTGGVIPEQPIDSTDAQTTEYSDNISSVSLSESKFEYWVQAVEGNHNNYGIKEKCNSNIISLFRETDMYFPNAFRPDGINNEFKPVFSGFGGSNYLLQIYNRWGQLIFETSDPEQGWDGKYKGNPSSHGTYIYILTYQNVFDITKQRQGAVTLIE